MLLHIRFHNVRTLGPNVAHVSLTFPLHLFGILASSPRTAQTGRRPAVKPVHPMANATAELWRQAEHEESNHNNTEECSS